MSVVSGSISLYNSAGELRYRWIQTGVILTEEHNVMANREELIGSTEYLTL